MAPDRKIPPSIRGRIRIRVSTPLHSANPSRALDRPKGQLPVEGVEGLRPRGEGGGSRRLGLHLPLLIARGRRVGFVIVLLDVEGFVGRHGPDGIAQIYHVDEPGRRNVSRPAFLVGTRERPRG